MANFRKCACGRPVRRYNAVICAVCWSDPEVRAKALYQRAKLNERERVDQVAEAETATLPRKDAFIPLVGEKLVAMMQRGEW